MIAALGSWLGTTVSRLHGWWLHRHDRRLPSRFWGDGL